MKGKIYKKRDYKSIILQSIIFIIITPVAISAFFIKPIPWKFYEGQTVMIKMNGNYGVVVDRWDKNYRLRLSNLELKWFREYELE